jgi:hypothetical protein
MKFWVFQCKSCGRWCAKEIRTEPKRAKFICRFCNKTFAIKKISEFGLNLKNYGPYENGRQASKVVLLLNSK